MPDESDTRKKPAHFDHTVQAEPILGVLESEPEPEAKPEVEPEAEPNARPVSSCKYVSWKRKIVRKRSKTVCGSHFSGFNCSPWSFPAFAARDSSVADPS